MNAQSQKHVGQAQTIVRAIAIVALIAGVPLIIGGLYIALAGEPALVTLKLLNYELSSTNIGVGIAFLGVILIISAFKSVDRVALSGGTGGNAEVIGDGEAYGGNGGSSGSFGPGGNGGNARVIGEGKAKGGAGGNG